MQLYMSFAVFASTFISSHSTNLGTNPLLFLVYHFLTTLYYCQMQVFHSFYFSLQDSKMLLSPLWLLVPLSVDLPQPHCRIHMLQLALTLWYHHLHRPLTIHQEISAGFLQEYLIPTPSLHPREISKQVGRYVPLCDVSCLVYPQHLYQPLVSVGISVPLHHLFRLIDLQHRYQHPLIAGRYVPLPHISRHIDLLQLYPPPLIVGRYVPLHHI